MLCLPVGVMHVLCSTNLFHLVVHRENDSICLTFRVTDGLADNWELISALPSYLNV